MKYPNIHIMIVGEPGVGKTRIALDIQSLLANKYKLSSNTEEWREKTTKAYYEANKIQVRIVTGTVVDTLLPTKKSWWQFWK